MMRYIREEMDTDSQERTVGQIEGFLKNLGNHSTREARKLLEFFGRLQKLVYENLYSILIAKLWQSRMLIQSYISRNPARYFDPDGPASPSSGQFEPPPGWRSWLMSACGVAHEELNKSWEVFVGGKASPARIADERVALDCGPVVDGQLRLGVGEELPPERAKGLWDLRNTGETVYSQIGDHPADPGANAITHDGDTRAGAEELLSGELVVGTGSREVGDELVTTCKNGSLISNRDWV
jgi:hypothetical protein